MRRHKRLAALAKPPGFVYATSEPGIEIENLLTPAILKQVLPEIIKDPGARKLLNPDELIFAELLTDTRLGTYLDRVLRPQLGDETPKFYTPPWETKAKTATLAAQPSPNDDPPDPTGRTLADRWKDKLARGVHALAVKRTLQWLDLSPTAQQLTRQLIDFIRSNVR